MFFVRLVRKLLYVAVVVGLVQYWLSHKSYIFDATNLGAVVKRHSLTGSGGAAVGEIRDAYKGIVREIRQFYGPLVLPDADLKWTKISHGGGGQISICPLHFSMTEYIILIGTALPSTAHSGRYWVNATIWPVAGSIEVWSDRYSTTTYSPGQAISLPAGEVSISHYHAGFWAIEYGRGFVPTMMPHMLAGVLFQNQDPYILYYLFDAFFKSSIQQFEFAVAHWRDALKF